jgi:radical SAM superfamily enzyme YgiQ (UPF0313 family)
MHVLLISPSYPDTFWSFKHALRFVRKRAAFPPLGLLTVAAMLPTDWDVRLVDVNVRRLRDADLAWADLVMVGAMTVQRDSARQLIARAKAAGKTVVAGGPLFAGEHADFEQVDHFVLGEAELSLPPFLDDLARGQAKRHYQPTGFADLATTPAPRWELADLKRYASMSVQFGRGCPFNCDFCNVTALFGHRPRVKSGTQVITELDALRRQGWRGPIFFVDDNLIGNKKALRDDLLPALIKWRQTHRHFPLQTEASINLADDPKLMRQMVDAGFDTVFVGIETPDDESLRECDKKQNQRRDLVADVKTLQRAGLQVQAGFIVGFDHDTPSIFQRQIDFIQHSGIVTAMVGLLQAPIGTRLYERMRVEGRLVGNSTGDNVDGTTNIRTVLDPAALRAGYRRIMQHIYAPEPYYQRIKTFLREYRGHATGPVRGAQVMAFARSVLRLGVLSRSRVQYWKLLTWSALRRPRQLPLAVTLWIYGHHFRTVCRVHLGGTG